MAPANFHVSLEECRILTKGPLGMYMSIYVSCIKYIYGHVYIQIFFTERERERVSERALTTAHVTIQKSMPYAVFLLADRHMSHCQRLLSSSLVALHWRSYSIPIQYWRSCSIPIQTAHLRTSDHGSCHISILLMKELRAHDCNRPHSPRGHSPSQMSPSFSRPSTELTAGLTIYMCIYIHIYMQF